MNGPTIALIFAENANNPKNCPSCPSGASSIIIVLETTHTEPMATPNKLAANQKVHIGNGSAAIVMAIAKTSPIKLKVGFEPYFWLIKPKTKAPIIEK